MSAIHYLFIMAVVLLFDLIFVEKEVTYQVSYGLYKGNHAKGFYMEDVVKKNSAVPTLDDIKRRMKKGELDQGFNLKLIEVQKVDSRLKLRV